MANCCDDLGSSANMQLIYVMAAIVYILTSVAAAVVQVFAGGLEGTGVRPLVSLMLLGVFVLWIIMISSRCCAPCCCQDTMPNVPSPCPVGPLNMAMNSKILDYPFMIGIGGEVVTTAPAVLLPVFFRSFRDDRGGNMMVLQLTRFLWVGLTTLGAFCAFRRFVMMRQQQLAGAGEVPPGMVTQGVVTGTTVGVPVGVAVETSKGEPAPVA
ncbi:unnamed protein product [Symbiodinium sp. CCMP2592]|nr:unnamed protein product [Symbiodinium sp. CCMP2592]